jgi:hypothetical protein
LGFPRTTHRHELVAPHRPSVNVDGPRILRR